MAEMADALAGGASAHIGRGGSSPPSRTRGWFRELSRTVQRMGRDGVIHAVRPIFYAR